jgi:hypothetical protein
MNLLSFLIAPLQVVVLFFAPHASAVKPASARAPSRSLASVPSAALRTAGASVQAGAQSGMQPGVARITYPHSVSKIKAQPIHRVRVVRNVDSTLPADRAGRMVVSGRFADVCAELERLAATEMRAAY